MTVGSTHMRTLLGHRSPRERRLILIASLVVAAGAILTVADWSISERERVRAQLPQAKAALTEMQANAASLQNLETLRAPQRPAPEAAAEIVMASARAHDIALELEVAGASLMASGTGSLPAILGLMADLQADFGLRPIRVSMTAGSGGTTFEIEFLASSS